MFEEKFQGDLQRNERVLWAGRPQQGITVHRELAYYWMIGTPFIAVSCGEFSRKLGATPVWREAFRDWSASDLRFVFYFVIGAWFMLAPINIERLRKPWVYYAVTNQRAILLFEYGRRTIRSLIIEAMPKLEMDVEADGGGTLRFGEAGRPSYMESPSMFFALRTIVPSVLLLVRMRLSLFDKRGIPGFADIPDVKRVYELVSSLRGPD